MRLSQLCCGRRQAAAMKSWSLLPHSIVFVSIRGLKSRSQAISRILFPRFIQAGTTIIHLVVESLPRSGSLPESVGRTVLIPLRESLFYLTLLRAGFAVPFPLPETRCALTAPFHPYRVPFKHRTRRYIFCGAFRRVTPPSRYEAHRPVEFGLSSIVKYDRDCLPDSGVKILGWFPKKIKYSTRDKTRFL